MKIQKIKNFLKKFFASVMLAIFTLSIFTPTTQAVSLTNFTDIPGVTGKGILEFDGKQIDFEGKSIYHIGNTAKGMPVATTGLCIAGTSDTCNYWLTGMSQFFKIDLNKYKNDKRKFLKNTHDEVTSNVSNHFYLSNYPAENYDDLYNQHMQYHDSYDKQDFEAEKVYFYWKTPNNKLRKIFDIDINHQCGTVDPHICYVGMSNYYYLDNNGTTGGVYYAYYYVSVYAENNDFATPAKGYLDYKDGENNELLSNMSMGLVLKNFKSSMGAKLSDGFADGEELFTILDDNGFLRTLYHDVDYSYMIPVRNNKWKMEDYNGSSYYTPISVIPVIRGGTTFIQGVSGQEPASFASYESYKLIEDVGGFFEGFMTGHGFGKNLKYNALNIFDLKGFNDFALTGTGSSGNPDNWSGSDNCPNTDVGCHIRALGDSIGSFFGNIWNGFADIIKGIFTWLWEKIYGFLEPIIKPIWEGIQATYTKIEEFFTEIYNLLLSLFKGGTDPTIEQSQKMQHGTGLYSASATQRLLCDKEFIVMNREDIEGKEGMFGVILNTLKAGFGIFGIIDPLAPTNGKKLCTYEGIKTLKLRENSFIDIILFLIFTSSLFLLFYKKS